MYILHSRSFSSLGDKLKKRFIVIYRYLYVFEARGKTFDILLNMWSQVSISTS